MWFGTSFSLLDRSTRPRFTNLVAHPRNRLIKFIVKLLICLKRFLHPHAHFLVHHVELFAAFLTLDSFAISFFATEMLSKFVLDASRETALTLLRQLISFLVLRYNDFGLSDEIHDGIVVLTR